ncbi:MAG: hypothetical protein KJ956_13285 [Actinobacteria bacterium]|nr:hypothetical protein [Actinomycetota bacterium]
MTSRRLQRFLGPLLVGSLVVAACGGGARDDTTFGSSTTPTVPTGGSVVTSDTLGSEGTTTTLPGSEAAVITGDFATLGLEGTPAMLHRSRAGNGGLLASQDVLDLFAAIYGDVPGADASRFEPGARDGTMAVRNVFRIWGDLTVTQRDAVLALLGFVGDQVATNGEAQVEAAIYGPMEARAALQTEEQVLLVAESIRDEIAGLVGVDLSLGLDIDIRESYPVAGEAIPLGGGVPFSLPFDTCRVILQIPPAPEERLTTTIAHEMFHCFQYASPDDSNSVPDWIIEGQAQWVGARIGGPDEEVHEKIEQWFQGSTASLFSRSYDAIGFFFAIEQAGVDPWTVMLGMLGRSNAAAVAATGLSPTEAVRWMGTTDAHADLSPVLPVSAIWQITAPEPATGIRDRQTVTEDTPYSRERGMPEYSSFGGWVFSLEEEVVTVTVAASSGALEFFDKPPVLFEGDYQGEFCLRPEGCRCGPDDAPELLEGTDQMILGVGSLGRESSAALEVSVSVEVEDIDDGGFADGHWEGDLVSTPITTSISGTTQRGTPMAAPFEFDVTDGVVAGTYAVLMEQRIDSPDLKAEGVGQISGIVTGCWFSPNLVPGLFSFDGTITTEAGTHPFVFEAPFDGTEGSPGIVRWDFDVSEPDAASGSLATAVFLSYMRSVGVSVNDVEIRFVATRTG